ncbi:MAG TPA: PAS domain S-box protein [Steroidobacteraceae bacterium]
MNDPPNPRVPLPAIPVEHYKLLVNSIRDHALFMLDPHGYILSWNPGAELIKGYSAADIIGSHFSSFYPPEALAQGLPAHELEVAAATGRFEDEGWRLRKDGSRFWANVTITRMLGASGELIGFSKVTRDLSERHSQDLALRESEERFRLLVSGVKDYAIFMLDPQGIVATWNTGAENIKRYSAQEIIGSHFSRFYPPEAIARRLPETELQGAMMQGRYEDEGWRLRKDGSRFWANVIITAVRNSSGRLIGFSKITRDLTERRQHEEDLRQSEEQFRLLVEGVNDYAIMMLNEEGVVTSWNSGAQRIKGYIPQEIIGQHISHFYSSEAILANKPWEELSIARREGRVDVEGWRVRKDGTLFWAGTVITGLRDAEGHPRGFAQVTQDLTGRRHAETLADTAQRMHEFIAMLAHELRNPLAPIRNAVALMGRKGMPDATLEAMRQTIDRQSIQLTRLLDELLDVNRIARGQFSVERNPVDMREVLARAVETSRPLIDSRGHGIQIKLPDQPVAVLGDAVRLTQAIVNLLNNAAKYTPDGGNIVVTLSVRGTEVEVRVRDSGKGIAPDMLEKIFDLFVQVDPTAGDALGGLGVGLALVRRVVELHGGNIQARSEGKGRGAEFVTRLPLSIHRLQIVSDPESAPQVTIRQMRIMVVDDNKDAADTLNLLLQSMGQVVCAVYDGASALSVAQTFQPDAVLLDIGMPLMSGYEVARAFHAQDPATRPVLVAITGWGQEADKERAQAAGFRHHFVKPVSEELLRAVLTDISVRAS